MKKSFLLLMVACLLCGCAKHVPYNYNTEEKVVSHSKLNEIQTVLVGDSIINYQAETISDALIVSNNLNDETFGMPRMLVPKGVYQKIGESKTEDFFNPRSVKGASAYVQGYTPTAIVYNRETKKLTLAIAEDVIIRWWPGGFKVVKDHRFRSADTDFQMRSIAYNGSHGKLVSFEYREGQNVQRITHDMGASNIFRHGGAEIEIISYDAKSMKCRVLKEMDVFM